MRLKDQIAVVTGGSSGIGKATAIAFGREGAAVAIVHHGDEQAAREIAGTIEAAGGRTHVAGVDVGDEAQVAKLFADVQAALGTPTILVNSAGLDAAGIKLVDFELERFEQVMRTNLTGPFLTCRAFVRGLNGGRGKIVNITSVHEEIPRSGAVDYDSSKGGLRNLTRTLALELAEQGVNVNNLAPGMVLTPMNQEAIDDPKVLDEQVQSIPMKRAATPEEVAELAVYLASKDADYVTGATFVIDGGLSMNLGQGA